MTLFPQIDTAYYTEDDKTVHSMLEYYYAQTITITQSYWSEADLDNRFLVNDQTLWGDLYGNMPAFRKRQFNFNRILRIRNMICGYQRQHRLTSVVTPVENGDNETADQLTKVMLWTMNRDNMLETISSAFEGAVTCGMNFLQLWMDYREDPISGNIRLDNLSYNEFLVDPFFKKLDLSDCRFFWVRKWLNKRELKSLFPERIKEIDSMYARGWRDGKFQFEPESYNYAMQDLLTYDEFYYLDYRKQKLLVDRETGGTLEWKGTDYDLGEYLRQFKQVTVVDQTVPTIKLAIQINGRTFYHGPQPSGLDRYMVVPVVCYYEPQTPYFPNRVQGVVRSLRDAQYLYNRRKIIELDILESQINSGIKFKEDSLVNPQDAFLSGQGRSFALKKDASMDDVQAIPPPQIPASMIQLSEILAREIQEISGISEELLGMNDENVAGVLSMLRQGAALTTIQKPFDHLNQSQRILSQIIVDLVQTNFAPGKVERIIKEKPTPEFYSKAFAEYDIVVEEGLYTATQRQMQFRQLIDLRNMGINIPAKTLIESSTLQNKKKLVEDIMQEEQTMNQQQQLQQQMGMQEQQAKIQALNAQSVANEGLGIERAARVKENIALAEERVASAKNQNSMSVYHELQAAKELEEMDLSQLHRLIEIIEKIKNLQSEQEQVEKSIENQQVQNIS